MRLIRYLVYATILILLLIGTPGWATTNFTPVIDTVGLNTIVYQNQTYNFYDQSFTPFPTFLFIAFLGLFFLTLSFILERNAEIFAALSIIPLVYTAFGALSIDMVTSFGMSGVSTASPTGISGNMWMLLENHTIYPSIVLMIVFLILSGVAFMQFIHELMQGKNIDDVPEEPNENE